MGDWGLGIGDWGLGIGPNPQSPIPNPQSPIPITYKLFLKNLFLKILFNFIYISINNLKINIYCKVINYLLLRVFYSIKNMQIFQIKINCDSNLFLF